MTRNVEESNLPREPQNSVEVSVMPGRNGGTLLRGGNFGNKGGGRTKSEVRALCLAGFAEALPQIVAMATGKGKKVRIAEQINAFDKLGKYGLGRATILVPDEFLEAFVGVLVDDGRVPFEVIESLAHSLMAKLKELEE